MLLHFRYFGYDYFTERNNFYVGRSEGGNGGSRDYYRELNQKIKCEQDYIDYFKLNEKIKVIR